MKRILIYTLECAVLLSLSAGLGSCAKDPAGADGPTGGENRFTLTFASQTTEEQTDDQAQAEAIYAGMRFAAYQPGSGTFSHEVVLKRAGNVYTGMMRIGTWGLAAVTPGNETLPLPGAGAEMTSTPMYQMPENVGSCPEIFFNSVTLPEIIENQDTKTEMALARNMSQVYVRIADKHGIVKPGTEATVSLTEVPSTISWAGTILRDKVTNKPILRTAPIVLTIPDTETWRDSLSADGNISFKMSSMDHHTVIPAHRGSDFWNADGTVNDKPIDILEHKMKISLTYTDKWDAKITIDATAVPEMPRCNGRIVYNLIPQPKSTDVVIETQLLPWNVEESQTEIVKRNLNAANCVVVAPGTAAEFSVEDVFQTWNGEHSEELGGKMDQAEQLVAEVLSGSDLITAEVVNPMGGNLMGAHCAVLVKAAKTDVTGEATVGLKLKDDNGYRWIWHVHVTKEQQAHTGGHCSWTAEASADRDWGSAAPDQQKGFGVAVTKAGTIQPTATKAVTLKTEPGAFPYKVTLVTTNGGSTKVDAATATICLWDGTQMREETELYAVPGHATDIYVQIKDATRFTGGYLRIEQCNIGGGFGTAQYVQVGTSAITMADVSVTYAGGTSNLMVPRFAVTYPGNTTVETVTSSWTAQPCDEEGNPAASDWLTLTTATADGGGSITMRAAPQTGYAKPMKMDPLVSGYDLSTQGGRTARNTANCYLVHATGTYTLPLVYGNAIKDGADNKSAYTSTATGERILTPFLNHLGVGITDPYIKNNNITLTEAKLLWQDVEGMIDPSSVSISGDNLTFRVTDNIDYGNAVLAVYDDQNPKQIAWSWHIWATDYKLGTDLKVTTYNGTTHKLLPVVLGWCPGAKYEARSQRLLLTEAGTGATVVVTVDQGAGSEMGTPPLYQWGRKDPQLPSDGTPSNTNKTWYNAAGTPSTAWNIQQLRTIQSQTKEEALNVIKKCIQMPTTFAYGTNEYFIGLDGYFSNLWAGNKETFEEIAYSTESIKTVYDPCPAGYKVPIFYAFAPFFKNGISITKKTLDVNGTWNNVEHGWYFDCTDESGAPATVFFPATGYRWATTGNPNEVCVDGSTWSADSEGTSGYNLVSSIGGIRLQNTAARSNGITVRPEKE